MLSGLLNYLREIMSAILELFNFGRKKITNNLSIFVKTSNGASLSVDLDTQWDIQKLKDIIAPQLGMQPDEVKIIFAGKELDDMTKFYECDLGQQSVLHAVKVTSRKSPKNPENLRKCLDSIYDDEHEPSTSTSTQSKPLSSTLIDLQLNDSDRRHLTDTDKDSYKACFFVHCADCKKTCRGKLRVRCNICKSGAIVLVRDPECWDDVLKPHRIHGICEANEVPCTTDNDNGIPFVEFFFKCAEHSSTESTSPTAVPLNLIKSNLKNVRCLSCGDVGNPVLIFPCKSGHCICLECFQRYCESKIHDRSFVSDDEIGYTLACPVNCANSLIREVQHFKVLSGEYYQRYQRFATEEFVIKSGGALCPRPDCGMGLLVDEDCTKVHCRECGYVFCKNCHQGFHIGECLTTSSEYFNSSGREYSVNFDRIADAKWDEASNIAIKVLTKPCPKCRTATERAGGCMHMDCTRCNFEWCWVCQIEWNRDCMGAHWFG